MSSTISGAFDAVKHLFSPRPNKIQLAALCYRGKGDDREVLLVTSRGTGRWVIPKGWPIDGTNSTGTALQEAWEEAGVKTGVASDKALGKYTYDKDQDSGWSYPIETSVYPVEVTELRKEFPEASERKRAWFSLEQAANLVNEPSLKKILRNF